MDIKWYAVHTYSGYENKVKDNLEKRIESMNVSDKIFRIIVPMSDEVEYKDGVRKVVRRKTFPSYILVEMILTDETWYVVRNTPCVTGFLGAGNKPVPLEDEEAKEILRFMGYEELAPVVDFELNEVVRIINGPFQGIDASIQEINVEKEKLKVLASMFGRETVVELNFDQVQKLD